MSEWSMQTECLHMHEMTNLFILPPHHADPSTPEPTSEAAVSVSAVLVIAISLVVALAAQASMLPLPA